MQNYGRDWRRTDEQVENRRFFFRAMKIWEIHYYNNMGKLRIYIAKIEPKCKLWILDDNGVSMQLYAL